MRWRERRAAVGLAIIILLALSGQASAAPVNTAKDVWFTFTADAQGNYPGGTLLFTIFAVDTSLTPGGNESIESMGVTTPWGDTNATGLPITLLPQESTLVPIEVTIPTSYTFPHTFVASFHANAMVWNGGEWTPLTESGNATVDVLAFPTTQASEVAIPSTVFWLGAGAIVLVVIVLLALFVRARRELNRGTSARQKKFSHWKDEEESRRRRTNPP